MNVVGLLVAILAAAGFATSTSLQHHANTTLTTSDPRGHRGPEEHHGRGEGHFASLLRQPWWVVGQAIALVAFALHAWALRVGLLVVVQPVVVSGIVLAVPIRAALERRLPHLGELGTVALTATGLTAFLLAVHPTAPLAAHPATGSAAVATLVGAAAALAASRWAKGRSGIAQATGYGAASGVLFGLSAGLVKLAATAGATATSFPAELAAVLTAWPTWLVPLVGVAGVVLNQRAYRAARLSASMPLLNIIDVLVAIAFGIVVFSETPAHRPLDLAGQGIGITLMLIGLHRLARDPGVDAETQSCSLPTTSAGSAVGEPQRTRSAR
ncbi:MULTISPECIES: DMT family transporter [unclassified Nocardioides]|uniref:DMT family transporter n=1 Tax=unclassified Nocardioides TaxID=2615069 RepID=UPI000056F609|nr:MULTISPECIES: DMT family transporter [unclassified Nocardioides]ABL81070.1 hypothetical protein Noca_1556 [Nocardioides sp. JS614]